MGPTVFPLINAVVAGLIQGGSYALFAFGLAVLFSMMRLVNFAHGDLLTIALYAILMLATSLHLPLLVAILVTVVGMAILGALLYLGVFERTLRSKETGLAQVLATIGISLMLQNALLGAFGANTQVYQFAADHTWTIAGEVRITLSRALPLLTVMGIALLTWVALRYTTFGLNARAVAESRDFAVLAGISVRRTYLVLSCFAFAVVGVTAGALAPSMLVYPTAGFNLLLIAFMAVVIGGLGSLFGSVAGGFILGVVGSLAAYYVSPVWAPAFMYVFFVGVLLVRPHGLFGDATWRLG